MKKHLKKVTALALAALTVTSASSVAFAAAQGDVDTDTFLTANDAAIVHFYVNDSDEAEERFGGSKIVESIQANGGAFLSSVLQGGLAAKDASRILAFVNSGESVAQALADDYQAELQKAIDYFEAVTKLTAELRDQGKDDDEIAAAIKADSTLAPSKIISVTLGEASEGSKVNVTVKNMVVRNANGTFKTDASGNVEKVDTVYNVDTIEELTGATDSSKVMDLFKEILADAGLSVEELDTVEEIKVEPSSDGEVITTSASFTLEYGEIKDVTASPTTIELKDDESSYKVAKVTDLDKDTDLIGSFVNALLSNTSYKDAFESQRSSLLGYLTKVVINDKNVGDDDGWKLLGSYISTDVDSFVTLKNGTINSDYAAAYKKAFDPSKKAEVLAKVEGLNIKTQEGDVSLIIDGVQYRDAKEVIKQLINNFLYVEPKAGNYTFAKLALALPMQGNKAFVISKSSEAKVVKK